MAPPRVRIRRYGDACLRRRARAVDPTALTTAALVADLWRALDDEDGVGLAAPQIGRDERVIVVRAPSGGKRCRRLTLVNPVVVETFGPETPFEEGCLSFPGLYTRVWRRQGVLVRYDDPGGQKGRCELRDEGLVARIVQHEIDHLDGVLFIDHLTPARRLWLAPRLAAIAWRGRLRR